LTSAIDPRPKIRDGGGVRRCAAEPPLGRILL